MRVVEVLETAVELLEVLPENELLGLFVGDLIAVVPQHQTHFTKNLDLKIDFGHVESRYR